MIRGVALSVLLAAACADDLAAPSSDAGAAPPTDGPGTGGANGDAAVARDAPASLLRDAAPPDAGVIQTEPPLTVPDCNASEMAGRCCPSALGFEDGSTDHFLPPACCNLALFGPLNVSWPTACGRGALRLDAAFRASSDASLCDQSGASDECNYRTGEVSRAVLTSLDVTGLTMSAAVFLEGPPLPSGPIDAQLFVLGQGGRIDGPRQPLVATNVWTAVELPVADDGTRPGADVRLLGLRISFHGQAWAGRAYLDEISWR